MKLKKLIFKRHRTKLVRQFGQAKLVKLPNGEHELIGGSDADRTAAVEWVSLFASEIVFTHFHGHESIRNLLTFPTFQAA